MFNHAAMFRAGGTIAPMRFVVVDATAAHQVIQAGVAGRPIGISQVGMKRTPGLAGSDTAVAAEAGDALAVFALGDVCPLEAGAAVVPGNLLKSDVDGKGIPTAAVGDLGGAIAIEAAGAAGTIINVQIVSTPAG